MTVMEARRDPRPWLVPLVLGVVRDYRWPAPGPRLRVDFWVAYWNRSGEAVIEGDDGSLPLDEQGLVLIPPLAWVRRQARTPFDQWWCHFTLPAPGAIARPIRLPCAGQLGVRLRQSWRSAWSLGCQHPATVASWHAVLGLALTRIPWDTSRPDPGDRVIASLQAELLATGLPPVGNALLARRLGMHEKSLCRSFRRATGAGLQEWLRQRRIDRAALALADGQEVDAVVAAAGFADRSQFSRQFTRSRGIGPGLFRRLARSGRLEGEG